MGKRIGYFLLSIVTFIAAFAVIFIVQNAVALPSSVAVIIEASSQGITDNNILVEMTEEAIQDVLPYCVLASHISLIVVFALWYRLGCGKPSFKKANLGKVFTPKHLAGMLLVAVGLGYFMNFGMQLVYPLIPEDIWTDFMAVMEEAQVGESTVTIIATILLAPIGEELVFRGVAFYYMKKSVEGMANKKVAFWIANSVQALLFGVLHMNIVQGTYAVFLGLILGYLAYRFKSVLPAMLGHMVYNGLPTFTMEPLSRVLPESMVVYGVIVIVSFVVIIAGLYVIKPEKVGDVVEA